MRLPWDDIQANAITFSKRWEKARREKADEQPFIIELLGVFGVDDPVMTGERQKEVKIPGQHTRWIDYFWKNKIAVEMKSTGEPLDKAYWQLRERYMDNLPSEDVPDLWLVCDFQTFHLRRMSTKQIIKFSLKELRKNVRLFADIAGYETERIIENQIQVNVKAAEKMAKLHNGLKSFGYEGHNLEVYLVRLLFCMFADDTGIFSKDSFYHYIEQSKEDGSDLSFRIFNLFDVLNTDGATRTKRQHLSETYNKFRYVNGALFETPLPPAEFDSKMRVILLDCINFDWAEISPAIFGAMFQGVMDEKQRREMGAHYTSEENILKLINPLFMDELWAEFDRAKLNERTLEVFHEKISKLKFLDPACGCGNFLIITYREIRMLELEVLRMRYSSRQLRTDFTDYLRVSIEQFYGIEYENFPCQIAQVGMWLIDHQMNMKFGDEFGIPHIRLPLMQSATIVYGNALRMDWEDVVPKCELSYILGNPPFVGQAFRTKEQAEDVKHVFSDNKNAMKLDYVTAWFKVATDIMKETNIRTAFVSVNSICQGESVPTLWEYLFAQGVEIDFAYQTFKWTNEARGKAAVMCVIIGFSISSAKSEKKLFESENYTVVSNINGYLHNAPNVFVKTRSKSINKGKAKVVQGSPPADNGDLQLSLEEMEQFISKYPESREFIKPFLGSKEFINDIGTYSRYCFWLRGVVPNKFNKIPELRERFQRISKYRAASPVDRIQKTADRPYLFTQDRQPDSDFIAIPRVSSERRRYIPMGFLNKDIIVSDAVVIVDNATLYDFGILTSNVHNAWMRTVCGRLKSDYRYAPSVFYNFPMPIVTDEQTENISKLGQNILDTRAKYPESSLADLYDPLYMPPDLLKAHRALDSAVQKLYGFPVNKDFTEAHCVAALMEMYSRLTTEGGR